MVSIEDLRKYETELKAKFGGQQIAVAGASRTIFSVARHYGGCKISGKHFVYNAEDDSLIREDVVKWVKKRKKQGDGNEG